jgi:hypothetical protein
VEAVIKLIPAYDTFPLYHGNSMSVICIIRLNRLERAASKSAVFTNVPSGLGCFWLGSSVGLPSFGLGDAISFGEDSITFGSGTVLF